MKIPQPVSCKVCGNGVVLTQSIDTETKSNIYTIKCKCGNRLRTRKYNDLFLTCPDKVIEIWNEQNMI